MVQAGSPLPKNESFFGIVHDMHTCHPYLMAVNV